MASHNELKGSDLHEPSRSRIINLTGSEMEIGTWFNLQSNENSDGFIEVTNQATGGNRIVGLVTDENIASGTTGTVLTLGRILVDTTGLTVNDTIRLDTSTTYVRTVNPVQAIGTVLTVGSPGTVLVDTLTIPGVSGTATSLGNLSDVTIDSTVANGEVIVFENGEWINAVASGITNVDNITEDTATGIVTVSFHDGSTLDFQAGQRIAFNSVTQTYASNLDIIGSNNIITAGDTTTLYTEQTVAFADADSSGVSPLVTGTMGGTSGQEPLAQIRNLRNVDGNIDIALSGTSSAEEYINIESPAITTNTEKNTQQDGEIQSNTVAIKDLVGRIGLNEISQLDDVEVTSPQVGQALIDALRVAEFDFEFTESDDNTLVTLAGLNDTIVASIGQPIINFLNLSVRDNQPNNTNDITLTVGSSNLNIIMNFTSATVSIDNVLDRLFATISSTDTSADAVNINWDRSASGAGGLNRTIDGSVYVMSANFTKITNPSAIIGNRSSGSVIFSDGRSDVSDVWDIGNIRFDIADNTGHGHNAVISPDNAASSISEYVARIVTEFNSSSILSAEYVASSSTNTFTVTAKEFGPRYDGSVSWQVFNNNSNPGNDLQPSNSNFVLAGGITPASSNRIQWTNTPSLSEIVRITGSGPVDLVFNQGGAYWENQTLTLNSLDDVTVDATPNTNDALRFNGTDWVNSPVVETENIEDLDDVQVVGKQNNDILKFNSVSQFWENTPYDLENLSDVDLTIDPSRSFKQIMKLGVNDTEWRNEADILSNQNDVSLSSSAANRADGTSLTWNASTQRWVETFLPDTLYMGVATDAFDIPTEEELGNTERQGALPVIIRGGDNWAAVQSTTVTIGGEVFTRSAVEIQPGTYRVHGNLAVDYIGTGASMPTNMVTQLRFGSDFADVVDRKSTGAGDAVFELVADRGVLPMFQSNDIVVTGVLTNHWYREIVPIEMTFTVPTYIGIMAYADLVQSFGGRNIRARRSSNYPQDLRITRIGS